MRKKCFHSVLFRKIVLESDPEYWIKLYAEVIYRIEDIENSNCNCFKCREDHEKLKDYLQKLKSQIIRLLE